MDENNRGPRARHQALRAIRDLLLRIATIVRLKNRGVFGPTVYRFYGPSCGPKVLPAFRRASITEDEYEKFRAARKRRTTRPPKV